MDDEQEPVRLKQLPDCLTINEAALILRMGRNACYEAVRRGDISSVRIGGRILIPRTALLKLLSGE